MTADPGPADLVLAGGGVKGIGLSGAVVALADAGYRLNRVSGTSAGAVVGAVVAAGSKAGWTGEQMRDAVFGIEYDKFLDPGPVERIPLFGPAFGVLRGSGLYRGDYAHAWIRDTLKDLGVSTFGDLRMDDEDIPEERRYRLVVTVTDITRGLLVRLPWDYRSVYGLDPDEQSVADAVRASMSIPFYFRPATLTATSGLRSTLVDGGLLSNFPIDSLDRIDTEQPRWPTFGVTVLPNLPAGNDKVLPPLRLLRPFSALGDSPELIEGIVTTVLVGRDQAHLNQPWVSARTIRVDSTEVGVLDFDIDKSEIEAQFAKGYEAAQGFLSTWNWVEYVKRYRSHGKRW
ncbi:phospholipase [Rhodococcus ruber Chol-4]|uniref:patatin-like phospholipase family protein n=1 Tax=Rhodococcus ruber TaxID=1830 RepID=UPI00034AB83F|nr:patatin-like phospholipase family protein [Rhodococcus ruber]KXF85799.1 phospholipase [Rhodococcus ruber Chol-4]